MIVPSTIRRSYAATLPTMRQVQEHVESAVRSFCNDNAYPFTGRLKSLNSVAEKIESGRYQAWTDLDDLYACSIVIPTLDHEEQTLVHLRTAFQQIELRQRGTTKKDPAIFRFEATRFIGRLRAAPGLPDEAMHRLPFEIQIRSAFEHAWSAATHSLVYKSHDVSWRWQRVAAQLKAMVEQLDALVVGFEQSTQTVVGHDWPPVTHQRKIIERMKTLLDDGVIPEELVPDRWGRFAQNLYSMLVAAGAVKRNSVESDLNELDSAIRRLHHVPRSISLMQLALGLLVRDGQVEPSGLKFSAPLTSELADLFPATRALRQTFDAELS